MRSSHTDTSMLRLLPEFGLVDLADARLGERLAATGARHLETFAHEMRRGLLAASVAIGLDVLGEMLAVDATAAAGPKGKHDKARTANWHGTESGSVTLGGRKVSVERPRVRTTGNQEVVLPTWHAATASELLSEHMVAAMLAPGQRPSGAHRPVKRRGRFAAEGYALPSQTRRAANVPSVPADERITDTGGLELAHSLTFAAAFELVVGTRVRSVLGAESRGGTLPDGDRIG